MICKVLKLLKSYTSEEGGQIRVFDKDKFHTIVRTMLSAYVQTQLGKKINYLLMLNLKFDIVAFSNNLKCATKPTRNVMLV